MGTVRPLLLAVAMCLPTVLGLPAVSACSGELWIAHHAWASFLDVETGEIIDELPVHHAGTDGDCSAYFVHDVDDGHMVYVDAASDAAGIWLYKIGSDARSTLVMELAYGARVENLDLHEGHVYASVRTETTLPDEPRLVQPLYHVLDIDLSQQTVRRLTIDTGATYDMEMQHGVASWSALSDRHRTMYAARHHFVANLVADSWIINNHTLTDALGIEAPYRLGSIGETWNGRIHYSLFDDATGHQRFVHDIANRTNTQDANPLGRYDGSHRFIVAPNRYDGPLEVRYLDGSNMTTTPLPHHIPRDWKVDDGTIVLTHWGPTSLLRSKDVRPDWMKDPGPSLVSYEFPTDARPNDPPPHPPSFTPADFPGESLAQALLLVWLPLVWTTAVVALIAVIFVRTHRVRRPDE